MPASSGEPSGVVVDLLFASCGIEPELVRDAEPLEVFEGLTLPVARLEHLLAMKVLACAQTRRTCAASGENTSASTVSGSYRSARLEDPVGLEVLRELGYAR